jgi:hypothetical protein
MRPTRVESGFPGFDASAWFGLMAPAGTAPAIIDKLSRETARVLAAGEVRKRLDELGMEVIANTSAEFTTVITSETAQWDLRGHLTYLHRSPRRSLQPWRASIDIIDAFLPLGNRQGVSVAPMATPAGLTRPCRILAA